MRKHPVRLIVPLILALLLLLFLGGAAARFYTEVLWFNELGYGSVLWRRVASEAIIRLITTVIGGAIVLVNLWLVTRRLGPVQVRRRYGNLEIAEQIPRRHVVTGIILTALVTGLWLSDLKFGGDHSLTTLSMLYRENWGVTDPLFQRDLSFYVFNLPFAFQVVDFLLLTTFWSIVLSIIGYAMVGSIKWSNNRVQLDERARLHLLIVLAGLVVLLGIRYWLSRYSVLFEGSGFNGGVGYTDVHARLPAHRAVAVLTILVGGAIAYGALRRKLIVPLVGAGLLAVAAIVLGLLYPSAIQKLRVEPNQLAHELPYIRWNLEYTRRGFGLDSIQRRTYPYRRNTQPLQPNLSSLPIWDAQPLRVVLNETVSGQIDRFADVDFDRYETPAGLRQVAISVLEFDLAGLPPNNRTWMNLHVEPLYMRGTGTVVIPAAEKAGGNPVYWLRSNPVEIQAGAPPQLNLVDRSVYVGETMDQYAVLGTTMDTANTGMRPRGIPIGSFIRVLAFAWRFSDKNLLFSGQRTDSSRILFRRKLDERLRVIAPFILWDADPLPVIHLGRVHWLVDGYSHTASFPIARAQRLQNAVDVRYLRPSVKALVDGVTGAVTLYALTEREPMLATWRSIFPKLFTPISELPAELQPHLRYPAYYLRQQADILEKYHSDRGEVFYAGQEYWQAPRERAEPNPPSPPIYLMLSLTPAAQPEFVLATPFIPSQRQNLTAILIARNDPPHYGELLLLELPRTQRVPGPSQVEALMEQDPVIAPQLALLRQRSSDVDLGQVRIVPVDSSLIYVVPVYQVARTRPNPELQHILVSDGNQVVMASAVDQGLGLLRGAQPAMVASTDRTQQQTEGPAGWSMRAIQLLDAAEASLRSGDWAGYGARLKQLRELLQQSSRSREPPR